MLGRDSRPQMSVPQIAELLRFSYKERGVCAQDAAGRAPSARGTRGVEQVSCTYLAQSHPRTKGSWRNPTRVVNGPKLSTPETLS